LVTTETRLPTKLDAASVLANWLMGAAAVHN
jgi:hypothetical protein